MPKDERSNRVIRAERITEISKLLFQGMRRVNIIKYVQEETDWNIVTATIDSYIKFAYEKIAKSVTDSLDSERGRAISRLNMLFYKCIDNEKYADALNVQKELNKLLSLYIINHNVTDMNNTIKIEFVGDK